MYTVCTTLRSAVCRSLALSVYICMGGAGSRRGIFFPLPWGFFFLICSVFRPPTSILPPSLPCCMLFAAFGRRNLSVRVLFIEFGSWNLLFCCCYVCCCYVCCCAVCCCNVCCCCFLCCVCCCDVCCLRCLFFAMVVAVMVVDVMFVVVMFVVVIVVVIVFIVVMVVVAVVVVAAVVVAGYAQINSHKYVSKWLPAHMYIYIYTYTCM